jgi:hypothetical protein
MESTAALDLLLWMCSLLMAYECGNVCCCALQCSIAVLLTCKPVLVRSTAAAAARLSSYCAAITLRLLSSLLLELHARLQRARIPCCHLCDSSTAADSPALAVVAGATAAVVVSHACYTGAPGAAAATAAAAAAAAAALSTSTDFPQPNCGALLLNPLSLMP